MKFTRNFYFQFWLFFLLLILKLYRIYWLCFITWDISSNSSWIVKRTIGDYYASIASRNNFCDQDTGNKEAMFRFCYFLGAIHPILTFHPNFALSMWKSVELFRPLIRSISFSTPFPEDNGDESQHSFESNAFDLISWPDLQLNSLPPLTFYLARRETTRDIGWRHHFRSTTTTGLICQIELSSNFKVIQT